VIEGTAEGLLSVVTALSGRYSDRMRRRVPFIRAGYGLAALSKPLLALAYGWPVVLVLRALDRLGKGLRTSARDALIADASAPARRGAAFGFHRAMDTAGAFVGVLCASAMLGLFPGRFRLIFALTALPAAIAVGLTMLLRELPPSQAASPTREPTRVRLGASFWRVVGVLWVFAIANSSDAFLLLRAKSVGFSDMHVVWAYALMNLTYTASAFPAGKLSDRIGRTRVIAIGWAIYAIVYASFAFVAAPVLWLAFAIYGLYMGLTQGVAKAWIADHSPADQRGTAQGIYGFGLGVCLLASSAIAGWLWDSVGPAAPFAFGSAACLIALACLPWAARTSTRSAA
jgi:MFS family permease